MLESNHLKAMFIRAGIDFNGFRFNKITLVMALCALSMAFFGCSAKGGKPKVVVPTDPNKPEVKAVASALDSLVKANKGKGLGVVTGFLTGESKSIASGLLKQASNAAGERRLLTKTEIPLTGATILVFNSLKPTTLPDAKLTTDSTGSYVAVLPAGKYFGFAVYLDLETFQLVTTSIPNMNPMADTALKMDTAIAIEDVTAPSVSGVYDATTANADGIFLVGSVADKGAKLNITFSEPMSRDTTSSKRVIIGKIDTSNTSTSMVLADAVKGVGMSWSGDSKELTLTLPTLETGVQYGLIIPVNMKDLAKNPLDKEYKATFVTVAGASLAAVPFAVTSTFPEKSGSIKPIQNPGVSFSRPVEAFSILKNAKIEPAVTGYFEVSGARAVFIHKLPLTVGKTYTITLPVTVMDLAGSALAKEEAFSFTVKDFEGAASADTGRAKQVALAVEGAFDAYLAGDVGRFGAAFHANFRMYSDDGTMKSKTEFLDMIRKDVGESQAMSAGFPGPVFDNATEACKDGANINRWKVGAEGGVAADQIWVDAFVSPGQTPRAYTLDKVDIKATDLTWDPTGPRFTYKGKKYGFGPDMTKFFGPVNMDAARGDMRFMGDMLRQTSTVVLEAVKLDNKSEFHVDPGVSIVKDTAKLAVKMIDYRKFNRLNFGDMHQACSGSLIDTSFQILKFTLVFDGAKWLVTSIISPSKQTNRADYDKAVDTKDFGIVQAQPINLLAPLKDNAMDAVGKITFKFNGVKHDSVGGYVVGLAEDPKFCFGRPPYGALIFVKASNKTGLPESFVLNSAGGVEGTNASMILRRAQDLKLPGWERTMYENAITKVVDVATGFGGVYNWKVIAIKDTSAVQFLANGFNPSRFYGESDFGTVRGYFACKTFPQGDVAFNQLQNNQQQFVNAQPPMNTGSSFGDMDQDGVPDQMEIKYKTLPNDRNSVPDFRVDTDGDALADFLEAMLDPKGTDSLIFKKADAVGVKAEITKLVGLGIIWVDSDSDGFPDDIEMMSGFNPMDAKSNPGTRARASAPVGVFAGKFQMGANLNSISFKLYTDTLKLMWVTYSAVIGKDTLADTVRTLFDDMSGEVRVPITLSKTGPDAGRALLLRGHFDPNQSLMMGPVDMIAAVAKTSTNFGSGPYVGQFAASGRGEDVTRFLPGSGGGPVTGGIVNPINNPQPMTISYRLPPPGVKEGSLITFTKGSVTLVDDFGDTLAVVDNLMFRSQPDGSFEFQGEKRVTVGTSFKRSEVGGKILYDGKDSWIVDGHFFQESDSAGIHKSYPGQINAKALKPEMTPSPDGIMGVMKGWIAQDKTGAGFVMQPGTNPTPCDPLKGPCNPTPVCDPAKGPCGPAPVCDPAKGCVTNPNPNPGTSFSKPFMGGTTSFKVYLEKAMVKADDYFYVSLAGRIYRVKYDSLNVQNAKMGLCGQVVLTPEALALKDASDSSKGIHQSDSMSLPAVKGTIFVLMEDQFAPGMPQRIDKARDSYGEIRYSVFVVEMRLMSAEYFTSMSCPTNIGPLPVCDPTKGPCGPAPVCDPTKTTCPAPVCDPTKGPCGPAPVCDPLVQSCPAPVCDPTKGPCGPAPVCDPTKGPCGPAPVCDPTKAVCGPVPPDSTKPQPYKGPIDKIAPALAFKANMVKVMTPGGLVDAKVDASTVMSDGIISTVRDAAVPTKTYVFLGDKMDPTLPMLTPNNDIVVIEKGPVAGL